MENYIFLLKGFEDLQQTLSNSKRARELLHYFATW